MVFVHRENVVHRRGVFVYFSYSAALLCTLTERTGRDLNLLLSRPPRHPVSKGKTGRCLFSTFFTYIKDTEPAGWVANHRLPLRQPAAPEVRRCRSAAAGGRAPPARPWDEPAVRQVRVLGGRSVSGGTLGAASHSPVPWSVLLHRPRGWGSAPARRAVGMRGASRRR